MNGKISGLTLFAVFAILLNPFAGAVTYDDHEITFVNVTGPEGGLCTWEYYVCSGTSPSISNWVLESCVGTTNTDIVWWSDPNVTGVLEYGTDPNSGITGIKFNVDMDDGDCATFWFKVKECSMTDKELGLKADGNIFNGSSLPGPSHEPSAPEFAFIAIPLTVMGFVLSLSYQSAKKKYQ